MTKRARRAARIEKVRIRRANILYSCAVVKVMSFLWDSSGELLDAGRRGRARCTRQVRIIHDC